MQRHAMATQNIDHRYKRRLQALASESSKALNVGAREIIARFLDGPSYGTRRSANGYLANNWEGLAEIMGFLYDEIRAMRNVEKKTESLLDQWERSPRTVGDLIAKLEQLSRYDILEDTILVERIEKDIAIYRANVQDDEVTTTWDLDSPSSEGVDLWGPSTSKEDTRLTILDDPENGVVEYFDAFVGYAPSDFGFVTKMLLRELEDSHNFKLCLPERDVLPGQAMFAGWADIVKRRCRKLILVISKAFLRSEECTYLARYGHSLTPDARNKKIIPIIVERDCPPPEILRFVVALNFNNTEQIPWLWPRLVGTLDPRSAVRRNHPAPSAPPMENNRPRGAGGSAGTSQGSRTANTGSQGGFRQPHVRVQDQETVELPERFVTSL